MSLGNMDVHLGIVGSYSANSIIPKAKEVALRTASIVFERAANRGETLTTPNCDSVGSPTMNLQRKTGVAATKGLLRCQITLLPCFEFVSS